MQSNENRNRVRALCVVLSLGVAGCLFAQTPTELGEELANNQAALHDFMWHRATTAKIDGEVVRETNERLFYDIDGTVQSAGPSTPLPADKASAGARAPGPGAAPARAGASHARSAGTKPGAAGASEGKGHGRKKGKGKGSSSDKAAEKAAKEHEKTMELIDDVRDAALSYGVFDPEQMKTFLQAATITPGEGVIKVQGEAFSDKSDTFTMELDSTSMNPTRLEVQSKLNGKPLNVTAVYQDVLNGPATIQRLVAEYPEEDLRVEVEDSGFTPADGSRTLPAEGQMAAPQRKKRPSR